MKYAWNICGKVYLALCLKPANIFLVLSLTFLSPCVRNVLTLTAWCRGSLWLSKTSELQGMRWWNEMKRRKRRKEEDEWERDTVQEEDYEKEDEGGGGRKERSEGNVFNLFISCQKLPKCSVWLYWRQVASRLSPTAKATRCTIWHHTTNDFIPDHSKKSAANSRERTKKEDGGAQEQNTAGHRKHLHTNTI